MKTDTEYVLSKTKQNQEASKQGNKQTTSMPHKTYVVMIEWMLNVPIFIFCNELASGKITEYTFK